MKINKNYKMKIKNKIVQIISEDFKNGYIDKTRYKKIILLIKQNTLYLYKQISFEILFYANKWQDK